MGKKMTVKVYPFMAEKELAKQATRAAPEVSVPSKPSVWQRHQTLGKCRALGQGRNPRLGAMPRDPTRPTGEPRTAGIRFCLHPNLGGRPVFFSGHRGAHARRPWVR